MPKKRKSKKTVKKRVPKESLKKDVLRLEKKLVDLEIGATELKEKLEKVDLEAIQKRVEKIDPEAVSGLMEKVESVDSLIMVEQVGIREIKGMMEGIQTKLAEPPKVPAEVEEKLGNIEKALAGIPTVPTDLEDKLGKIEKRLVSQSLSIKDLSKRPPPPTVPPELDNRIGTIERDIAVLVEKPQPAVVEIERLYDKLTEIEKNLSSLKLQTEGTLKSLYERLKAIEEKKPVAAPGVDFDFLCSKIDEQKSSIDRILKKMAETDLKLIGLDKKSEILEVQMRESAPEIIRDEIKLNRKDLAAASARMDSLERVAREMLAEQETLRKTIGKFENLERISLLGKDIEEKIERFKFIENEIRRLSSRVELIYDNIDKRLVKIKNIERRSEDLATSLSNMSKEIDKTRAEVLVRATRDDVSKEVDERMKTHLKDLNKILAMQEERVATVEEVKSAMEKRLSETFLGLGEEIKSIKEGVEENRENIARIGSEDIEGSIKKLEEENIGLRKGIEPLSGVLDSLDKRVGFLENMSGKISDLDKRMKSIKSMVDKELSDLTVAPIEDLKKQLTEQEKRISSVEGAGPDVKERLSEIHKALSARIASEIRPLVEKIDSFEKDYGSLAKDVGEMKPDKLKNMVEELGSRTSDVDNRLFSEINQINENVNKRLEKGLSDVSLRLSNLTSGKEDIDKTLEKLNKAIKKAEPERVEKALEGVNSRIVQIESRLASTEDELKKGTEELRFLIGKKISEVQVSVPSVDKQVKEMVDKLIFLETRLGAIEKVMRETSKTQPVILE